MSKNEKPQLKVKIGQIKLTEEEKTVLAVGMDSPFFKIIVGKILPKRLIQLAMTNISSAQTIEEVSMFRGRYAEATWLKDFLEKETKTIDTDDDDLDNEPTLKSKATTRSRQT